MSEAKARARNSTVLRPSKRGKKPAPPTIVKKSFPAIPIPQDLTATCKKLPGYNPWTDCAGYRFDKGRARKACEFFRDSLTHVKGEKARTPFHLEKWQQAIIGNLFGWVDDNGLRRYRTAFVFVPRKNGKTPLAAGIILYLLTEDGEDGAEVYGAASEFNQGTLVFQQARGMVLQNPALAARVRVFNGQAKTMTLLPDELSYYRVLSSDASSKHGFNVHGAVVDELHTFKPEDELLETLKTATAARVQPLIVEITTSDFERSGSICNREYDYACKVRDGVLSDRTFLPVIYEASKDADWTSPKTWKLANPNLGVSVNTDYLETACKRAQDSPAFENEFKRLHLNIRTEQDVRWIPMVRWDACAGEPVALEAFRGRKCWAGLDLASTRDLTALVMVFPEDGGTLTILPIFWIPKETALQRERRDRVPYLQWIREGWIRTTTGDATDYATIRRDINALAKDHGIVIKEIAADRLFQGDQLCQELREQDGFNVIAFGQGFLSMAAPTKRFEELILDGSLRHGGNPVLRWHASNVSVEIDAAGNMKPSRKKSTEKIDGIVAAIMAVGRTVSRVQRRSVYEDRGLLCV